MPSRGRKVFKVYSTSARNYWRHIPGSSKIKRQHPCPSVVRPYVQSAIFLLKARMRSLPVQRIVEDGVAALASPQTMQLARVAPGSLYSYTERRGQ